MTKENSFRKDFAEMRETAAQEAPEMIESLKAAIAAGELTVQEAHEFFAFVRGELDKIQAAFPL